MPIMPKIAVTNVLPKQECAPFESPFHFDINIEAECPLIYNLTFMVTYVGCAENPEHDQILEQIDIEIDKKGPLCFSIETACPNHTKIPGIENLLGLSVLILTAHYMDQEFFRCSYFVSNQYQGSEADLEHQIDMGLVKRSLLVESPKIMNREIDWNDH